MFAFFQGNNKQTSRKVAVQKLAQVSCISMTCAYYFAYSNFILSSSEW